MRRFVIFMILCAAMIAILTCCSGKKPATIAETGVVAEVNGEKITVQDLIKNPMFNNILKQVITEKIIKQEFKARGLKLDEVMLQAEWDSFKQMQGNDEEAAQNALKAQGMTKDSFMDNMSIKVMLQQIIEQDKPITMEDAKKDFESNLENNQKMYASFVPEKKEKPETITFDEVADNVLDNMRRRQFSAEFSSVLDTLNKEYEEKGWIKNYAEPEEEKSDLTTIEKPSKTEEEVDPSQLRKAPLKQNDEEPAKEEEAKENEKKTDETESEDEGKSDETEEKKGEAEKGEGEKPAEENK